MGCEVGGGAPGQVCPSLNKPTAPIAFVPASSFPFPFLLPPSLDLLSRAYKEKEQKGGQPLGLDPKGEEGAKPALLGSGVIGKVAEPRPFYSGKR